MKTKNIFLMALAFALLLTSACDKNEIVNTENTADKGYALPVTINVSRLGDNPATRATFNDGTKKLAFSTGDKLFVKGSWHEGDYDFAGTLTWVSGGTFSGTITTQTEWTGTVDELLSQDGGASATLLPAGYESYGFLSIEDSGYNAYLSENFNNAFATSKASGVEQLSYEYCYNYSSGFTLTPCNAILNFTITGLTASTEVAVVFSYSSTTVSKNVTTNGSGNATFAISVIYGTDLNGCTLTVGGNAITLVSSSKVLAAGKIYNIERSAAPAVATGHALSASAVGEVVGTDGMAYDVADKDNLPTGVTAAGMVAYKSGSNGLVIALADEAGTMNWSTANGTTTGAAAHTPTVTGQTWKLPSEDEWKQMFNANGSNENSCAGLNTAIGNAGGTALQKGYYWSSDEFYDSEEGEYVVRYVQINNDNASFYVGGKNPSDRVRACLAF